jgi:cytochrome c
MPAIPSLRRRSIEQAEENEMFKQFITATWLSATVAASVFSPLAAAADAGAGKKLFRQCAACHALDGKNRVGPDLHGVVGRPVASAEGFRYSKAMVAFGEGGKVWDEQLLAEYLAAPRTLVKGTTMVYAGLKKPDDIANLIEFLKDPAAAN